MSNISNEQLWEYVHGLLSHEESRKIDDQLKDDDQLRKRVEQLRAFDDDIQQTVSVRAPEGFAAKVMGELGFTASAVGAPLKTKVNRTYMSAIFGFFAIALATMLIFFFINIFSAPISFSGADGNVDAVKDFLSSQMIRDVTIGIFLFVCLIFLDRYLSVRNKLTY